MNPILHWTNPSSVILLIVEVCDISVYSSVPVKTTLLLFLVEATILHAHHGHIFSVRWTDVYEYYEIKWMTLVSYWTVVFYCHSIMWVAFILLITLQQLLCTRLTSFRQMLSFISAGSWRSTRAVIRSSFAALMPQSFKQ